MSDRKNKDWTKTWTSAASAIHGVLDYTDRKHYSLVDVMGITGHAFRINIDPEHIDVAGPTMFPGGYLIRRNLCNLGFISNLSDTEKPYTPETVEKVMALIQQSIDKGMPAISYIDFIESRDMLWVTTISESLPHSKYEVLRMALDMVVDHARGREWQHVFNGKYKIGLAGYDAWIACFERRGADPFGNAYNIAVVSDAREYAEQFCVSLRFVGMEKMLLNEPYAVWQPDDPDTADRALELLRAAKEAEEQGIKVLERLLNFMKIYWSEQ